MTRLMIAFAMALALPAAAHAEAAPAPAPKMACCEKMKTEGKECCCKDKDEAAVGKDAKPGADPHADHDMSKSGKADPAPPVGHQH